MIADLFAKPFVKYGAIALAVVALFVSAIVAYNSFANKFIRLGETKVIDAVQTKTIDDVEKARVKKEQTNDEVRKTPYSDRVDDLQ